MNHLHLHSDECEAVIKHNNTKAEVLKRARHYQLLNGNNNNKHLQLNRSAHGFERLRSPWMHFQQFSLIISERLLWPASRRATRWPFGMIFLAATITTSPRTKAWRSYRNEKILKVKRRQSIRRNIVLQIFYIYRSTEGIFVYCTTRPEVLSTRNETCFEAIRREYGRLFGVWGVDWLRCHQPVCEQLAGQTMAQGIQKD